MDPVDPVASAPLAPGPRPATGAALTRLRRLLLREVIPARHRRGAALVVVLLTVAIMTTVIIDFVFQTRVQLHMVVNQRDEVRAYYLAKSGLDLARLALGFQKQVNALSGGNMNIQIWQYLNQFMGAFNAAKVDLPVASVDLSAVAGLGGMKGAFEVEVEPEDGKINLNAFVNPVSDRGRLETIARLTFLMSPGEYKEMFENKDDKGNYNDIPEVIASIIDWIDPDSDLTTMTGDFQYTPTGAGQESSRYRDIGGKIEPRNAKLDTLEELHRIKGVGDDFYESFADSMTIYSGSKVNVNTANEQLLAVLICSHLANPQDPLCSDPFNMLELAALVSTIVQWQNLRRSILLMTPFPTKESFKSFLTTGYPAFNIFIPKPPVLDWGKLLKDIEVRAPGVYRIKAEGRIGRTTKTLIAVIDLNKKGKLYYWREF
ncbi:MAG: type II secretion system protein GspK [Myxococcota bacterium]|jgi:general secretion pathway protein K|nr:type II secretion system protein GspK [Myxococcota bacterium]